MYRELRDALSWFRAEWQADIPTRLHEGWSTVEPGDAWGAPAWTARFRRYLLTGGTPYPGTTRYGLYRMSRGNLLERVGAVYLFKLACLDFEPGLAAMAMTPPLLPEYAPYYCQHALGRLAQVMAMPEPLREVPRKEWMDRIDFRASEVRVVA